jgi:hypothetical protein
MSPNGSKNLVALLILLAVWPICGAREAMARGWQDEAGRALPFEAEAEILAFLQEAEVIAAKSLTSGINRSRKLTLEKDGLRVHAIFRSTAVEAGKPRAAPWQKVEDSYRFELAAYELSRMLGLDQVPPTVQRTLGGEEGALQLWIENARTEGDLHLEGASPPNLGLWFREKRLLSIFDNLIFNFDRHLNNLLVDQEGRIWFIDHTRSFPRRPDLPSSRDVTLCDPQLYERLRALDRASLEGRLGAYLDAGQIRALLGRRDRLVRHIDRLVAIKGEASVFAELLS